MFGNGYKPKSTSNKSKQIIRNEIKSYDWNKNSLKGQIDHFKVANIVNNKSMEETLKVSVEFIIDCIKQTKDDKTHMYGVKFEEVLNKRNN